MSKVRILIVEDEHIVAMDIQRRLEKNNYQVSGHTNQGETAIKLAEELRPDLILMDISLKSEMDGIEAATQIREQVAIPVIFLTAFADQSTTERARLAEPYGYLLKPFEERELIITIEMALYKHSVEIKLAESEARYRRLADNAPDIIFRYELKPEMKLTYINPAVEKITGYAPEECYTDQNLMFSMIHPDDMGMMENYMQTLNLPEGPLYARWIGKDEVVRWMESRLIPIMDSKGQLFAIEGITRDISDRKKAEDELRDQSQLAEALRDTAMALNSTLKLDEILDRILDNIGTLVNYDMAMVSLIEENKVQRTRYHNNPQKKRVHLPIGDIQANLITVPILKSIIDTRKPQIISNIEKDMRWQAIYSIPGMERIQSLACVPIEMSERVIGVINITSALPGFFTSLHIERISTFASQVAVALENARLYEEAQRLSTIDPLTEIFNRRYFLDFAALEFERVRRYKRALSVALLDIDHFKSVNDIHGHKVGDFVLREVALRIKKFVRTVDVFARYGGEEFVILMPETNIEEALQIAKRIREAVADHSIENKNADIPLTVSMGVADTSKSVDGLDKLIEHADQALYKAKKNGRNRVEVYLESS